MIIFILSYSLTTIANVNISLFLNESDEHNGALKLISEAHLF